ncbi:adenylate/guanylate cyclase domain-containing protein [Bradyrhizobium sp. BRP20]|uniref:adenylate/guanylate cyclase domain-containing protein n=1 Tax=Bradyrhizobium sp. BRP20 TaxID=2793822 RepID=UPI001CD2CCF7|nr:adenylate/guanylate cyclase domain-containing protein [Bradyrhizobium sp. BRP20]
MTAARTDRRLAAILAADVAGYSLQMGVDEEGTLARLKAVRKTLIDPTLVQHRGRIFKTTGDGLLVEFASAVDAVRAAVDIQRAMAKQNGAVSKTQRIEFRIGIHLGDIIIDDDDILGDGVNIAARLENSAEPGGICVSGAVHDQVRDKLSFPFADLGEKTLKHIARPIKSYGIAAKDMVQRKEMQKDDKIAKPIVVIVTGARSRIGKTTVAKTLLDYWTANQLSFRIFDASGSANNGLARFHPEVTRVVDLTSVDDQMAVFDTLHKGPKITLIEIGSDQVITVLRTLDRIGFIAAANSGAIDFKCLYVYDEKEPNFSDVRSYFKDGFFHPVFNELASHNPADLEKARSASGNIAIPALPKQAIGSAENESVGFLTYVANKLPNGAAADYSFVLRGYVRAWLAEIWTYYDKVEMWKNSKVSK